jgi:hypothetical protein
MRFTKVAGLLGVAVFAAFGLFLCYKGIQNLSRASASTHWPKTEATVSRSGVVAGVTRDKSDGAVSTMYSPDLSFHYQVNGVSHTTSTRHFGQTEGSGDSSEAELLHLRYPQDAKIPVYYDPAHPEIAVAEPGFQSELLWLPGAGFFLILPSIMFGALILGDGKPGMFDLGISLFGGIFLSLGVIGVAYGGVQILRAQQSVDWPRAQGQIVYGRVDASESMSKEDDGTTSRSTSFGARLAFRYVVDGRTYYSNQRRFGQLAGADEEWAAEIANRYPKGSSFPVAYSPANPHLAVLEPGFDTESLWLPGAGLFSLLFGLAVVTFARRALSPIHENLIKVPTTEKHKRYH